jgi:hypothetical protein
VSVLEKTSFNNVFKLEFLLIFCVAVDVLKELLPLFVTWVMLVFTWLLNSSYLLDVGEKIVPFAPAGTFCL